jgi:SAM-dependent methyltransferase
MDAYQALGCPYCQGALAASGEPSMPWQCPTCGGQFSQEGQIPVLFRRQDIDPFDEFARQYREARLRDGWRPLSPEEMLRLPYGRPAGTPALYWEVRCQSFCALMAILAREGPTPAHGPAADLGAGSGWLSYRLAQLGYRVLAVDASRDADWGLGAAERHYLPHAHFQLIQGDLEHPPLQAGKLGLIVYNASLHYVMNLEGALRRAAAALQPGGRIVILDTPIARRPQPGTGLGDRHLGRQELHAALLAVGLGPRWIPIRRGTRWWIHRAKAWLKRDAPFSFPLIIAGRLP